MTVLEACSKVSHSEYGSLIAQEAEKYLGARSRSHQESCELRYTQQLICEKGLSPKTGFDCSGFVRFIFSQLDITLPYSIRHCDELYRALGTPILKGAQQRGDLVFFTRRGYMPTHIGIMLESNRYIHAPGRRHSYVTQERLSSSSINILGSPQIYKETLIGFKRFDEQINVTSWPSDDRYKLLSLEYGSITTQFTDSK